MHASRQFLARLGVRHPIIQAPMAGTSTPALAAAVSEAGGLGSLGVAACNAAQARQAIEDTRALTRQPFNVNVFCHAPQPAGLERNADWLQWLAPYYADLGIAPPGDLRPIYKSFLEDDEMFEMLLAQRPAVVSFHFGLPSPERLRALRDAGILTFATATDLHEAQVIEAAGVDAIVAQGIEAGGHRGVFDPDAPDERLSTSVLTRLLATRTKLPVIAAGGIMDGQGVKAALELGAAAAQLGTAFILCPESSANAAHRAALKSGQAGNTRLTAAISGRPARGIVNDLMAAWEAAGGPRPAPFPYAYDANKQLAAAAAKQGKQGFAPFWAGQAAPLARDMPAAQLVATLAQELSA